MSTGRPKVILVSPTNSMTVSMRVTTYAMPTHSFGMTIFAFANMSDGSMIQSADTMARSGILVAPAHRLIWRKASRAFVSMVRALPPPPARYPSLPRLREHDHRDAAQALLQLDLPLAGSSRTEDESLPRL